MAKYAQKRRKVRYDRLAILVAIPVILIILVFGLYKMLTNNPYAKYEEYNEATKNAGSMQHETKEEENTYYLSLRYPEYEDHDVLNKVVSDYRKKNLMTNIKQSSMYYISVDYDSEEIYDSYISLTFHQTAKDENDKILKQEDVSYNYDKKTKKLLTAQDVLRRDYIAMLKKEAKQSNINEKNIKLDKLQNFIINKQKISFYFDNNVKNKIDVVYKDKKPYIKLANKNIPSYYMQDKVTPAKQPPLIEGKKLIAFTFDDGPHPSNTKAIMDEFDKYGGRATFFMLGKNVVEYPNVVKDVYKRGFEVANHSWDHSEGIAAKGTMNAAQVSDEVYKPNDEIFKLTGFEPTYFRPPYGAINKTLDSVCGLDMVLWDIDSEDWMSHNADTMTSLVKQKAAVHYEVVLMHDIHDDTVLGVKKLLKDLDAQGYQFVTLDTLMKEDAKYLTAFNNSRYHNIVIESNVGK